MSDLTPFYLASRAAKQADAEAAAGEQALAQFGTPPELVETPVETPTEAPAPADAGTVKVETDVSKIDVSKVPGPGQRLPTAGGTRVQLVDPPEPDPETFLRYGTTKPFLRNVAAAPVMRPGTAAPEQTGTGMLPAAERLGEFLFNVNTVHELQQKLSSPEGAGLIEGLAIVGPPITPGLSVVMPIVNVVMHGVREILETGGVPQPYVTIGELATAMLVPIPSLGGKTYRAARAAVEAAHPLPATAKSKFLSIPPLTAPVPPGSEAVPGTFGMLLKPLPGEIIPRPNVADLAPVDPELLRQRSEMFRAEIEKRYPKELPTNPLLLRLLGLSRIGSKEGGQISIDALVGLSSVAAGAAAGGMIGDTTEERARNALIGAGLAALAKEGFAGNTPARTVPVSGPKRVKVKAKKARAA